MHRNVLMGEVWLITGLAFLAISFTWRRSWEKASGGFWPRVGCAILFVFDGIARLLPESFHGYAFQVTFHAIGAVPFFWFWCRQPMARRNASK